MLIRELVKFFIFLLIHGRCLYMNLLIINSWFFIEAEIFNICIWCNTTRLIFQVIYCFILIIYCGNRLKRYYKMLLSFVEIFLHIKQKRYHWPGKTFSKTLNVFHARLHKSCVQRCGHLRPHCISVKRAGIFALASYIE